LSAGSTNEGTGVTWGTGVGDEGGEHKGCVASHNTYIMDTICPMPTVLGLLDTLTMKALRSFKTSETMHPKTRHHI
jgi:hypothetical protein